MYSPAEENAHTLKSKTVLSNFGGWKPDSGDQYYTGKSIFHRVLQRFFKKDFEIPTPHTLHPVFMGQLLMHWFWL